MSTSKIVLIISREYTQRVKKKSFIITTLLTPLLMAAVMMIPALLATHDSDEKREIVVVESSNLIAPQLKETEKISFKHTSASYEQAKLENANAFGFLVIGEDIIENPTSLTLYTRQSSTMGLENDITRQVSYIIESERINKTNIPSLDSIMNTVKARASLTTFVINESVNEGENGMKSSSSTLSMGIGYFGGFMIYMFIFIYGGMVLQGVIEEKSSRIIEVMVSSVKPFQLMMGKILGIACVALTQLIIWLILFFVVSIAAQSIMMSGVEAQSRDALQVASAMGANTQLGAMMGNLTDISYMLTIMGTYIIFFIGGYLLYAAMFAAVGSAVDNIQDAQQLQTPITIPLILSIIILVNVIQNPDSPMAFWFSIIPFTSPIVMMARISYGVPLWELVLSIVILYGSFVAITWLSAKIYRIGIFMYGKKPSLKELLKWARYKS